MISEERSDVILCSSVSKMFYSPLASFRIFSLSWYVAVGSVFQGKGYEAQLEENAGSCRQLRHTSLLQQGHSQPCRAAMPFFLQELNNNDTLPDNFCLEVS